MADQRDASDADEPMEAAAEPQTFAIDDDPQLDWGEPAEGAVYGANHTRRPLKTEADNGHGPKTRARSKEIINRRL